MKWLLLIIVFGLALLSFTAVTAGNINVAVEGYSWATRICSSAQGLCKYPHELAYAAVSCAAVWILMIIMK
jgi:hypothetical protein